MTTLLAPPPFLDDVTRRQFLTGTAAAAAVLLAGCGTGASGQGGTAEWSFTDDRGVTVELPARPTRVAAYTAPGAALLSFGIRPVAVFGQAPLADPLLEGLDLTGIASAGETYGEVNLEKLLALGVEVLVTAFDPNQDGPIFGFTDETVQQRAEQVAPIVAINGIENPGEVIRRFGDLAATLGADLAAPAVAASRQRYEDAREAVRAAVAGKPGLVAISVYARPSDGITVWRPTENPHTRQLAGLGLRFAELDTETADINESFTGALAETLSLEQAGKYPADLILLDRAEPEDMAGVATWEALPAVRAGQLAYSDATPTTSRPTSWNPPPPPSAPPTPTSSDTDPRGGPHEYRSARRTRHHRRHASPAPRRRSGGAAGRLRRVGPWW
ncbi:MAG: twin-arginine translocation signal domain-containing protein [Egibacteraceae bacterium]